LGGVIDREGLLVRQRGVVKGGKKGGRARVRGYEDGMCTPEEREKM